MQVSSGWCDIGGPRVRPILIEWGVVLGLRQYFLIGEACGETIIIFPGPVKKFFKLCNLVQLNLKEVR